MKSKAILITGVAGMIGSNFSKWMIDHASEYDIIGIDDLSGGYLSNVPPEVKMYVRDAGSDLSDIFKRYNVEFVYHFSAYAAEGLSPFIRKYNYDSNLRVTANIVNHCIKFNVKRIIFTSSMSVYGSGITPFRESRPRSPIDPYGIAKAACEMDIECAHEQHGLSYIIFRPHNVIGINQNIWDKYRNVIGIWMRQSRFNQPITIYGTGTQKRAFSWVDDCMPTFWAAATANHSERIYNIGGDDYYTLNDVADMVMRITGHHARVYLEPRHEVKDAYSNHDSVKKYLGFAPTTSLIEMLEMMWDWAETTPIQPVKEWDEFEIDNGMYNFWKKK